MKMIFTCSSEDIEFINKVNEEFASLGTIEEARISGITGYEVVMLVLQVASVSATTIVPFIIAHMTNNKDSRVKSKRCFIDNKNKTICFEGYDEETIEKIIKTAIKEQNKK